jgi:hypothetical protein
MIQLLQNQRQRESTYPATNDRKIAKHEWGERKSTDPAERKLTVPQQ